MNLVSLVFISCNCKFVASNNALGMGIRRRQWFNTTEHWSRMRWIPDKKASHYRKCCNGSAGNSYLQKWIRTASSHTIQLREIKSNFRTEATTSDCNDSTVRIGNGIQIMHSNSHLHTESVSRDINASSIFISREAQQMDDHLISHSHQLLEWTIVGVPVPRTWFTENYIRVAHILHATRINVCHTILLDTARRSDSFIQIIISRGKNAFSLFKSHLVYSLGPYTVEKVTDFSYCMVAYGIFICYHFGILEIFAVVSSIEHSLRFDNELIFSHYSYRALTSIWIIWFVLQFWTHSKDQIIASPLVYIKQCCAQSYRKHSDTYSVRIRLPNLTVYPLAKLTRSIILANSLTRTAQTVQVINGTMMCSLLPMAR